MNNHGSSIIEFAGQSATLRAGAEELVTILNGARQLAIKDNQTVCVTTGTTRVSYHPSGCGTAAWIGPGSESDGSFGLANAVQVSAATANATFTYLGGGGTGATYAVLNPSSNQALCVVVAPSGRIIINAPTAQPICP